MRRSAGRPPLYQVIVENLKDDALYTPAGIASHAERQNLLSLYIRDGVDERLIKQRIRITMGRLSNNKKLPDEGDGQIPIKGQSPVPAWFGWRWKAAYLQ